MLEQASHHKLNRSGWARFVTATVVLALAAPLSAAPREGQRDGPRDGQRDGPRDGPRDNARDGPREGARDAPRPSRPDPHQWQDTRHGHVHTYPVQGYRVPQPPPRSTVIVHGGARYWFDSGVWYGGRNGYYVVTRPPRGVVVRALPAFATVVVIGALSYYYANGVYYRPRHDGNYEVVDGPDRSATPVPAPDTTRRYVYPREGQSAERQASDEYECHRWAVGQSGVDPTLQATGQATAGDPRRDDYERAASACLDGRGYSVR